MNHKKIILTESFDTSFFVIGEAYQIYDNENDIAANYLLNDIHGDWITFYDQEGDVLEISLDEYKEKYDILRLVPSSELISVEPVPTISAEPECMETNDVDDNGIPEIYRELFVVCREVDYDNLTDRIIFGEDKLSELMSRIFGIDCAIHKFYYKIENMLINNGSVCKARYYISTEKLDDSYKLHPAFIEEDQHYPLQFVTTDMIKGDDNEIVTNISFKEFKDSIRGNVKMWNVEIVSVLQLLALVELGFKEANNERTTGKDYHGIKNLFNGYFQFVDGLTVKGNEIKVNGNTVCDVPDNISGDYIRYFKNMQPLYDWLFIPAQTTKDYDNSIGCMAFISPQHPRCSGDIVACLGGSWADCSDAGFFYWNLADESSASYTCIGTRTMID